MKNCDIVVFAGTTPWSVLSLCRMAHNMGARAYCVCVDFQAPQCYQNNQYVYKVYSVSSDNLGVFWKDFFRTNTFEEKPILFTTTDNSCLLVDDNRAFYEKSFKLCLPSSFIIQAFNDKSKSLDAARKNGLTLPLSIDLDKYEEKNEEIKKIKYPVIVKPVSAAEHKKCGFKYKIINNSIELANIVNVLREDGRRYVCQEYIEGDDKDCKFYIFYRNAEGELLECMGEKTMQSNGIMAIGTTKFDEQLGLICRQFLEKIGYEGIGGIEFKRKGDNYYFIEMSTRTEGFLPISDMSEVSVAQAAYLDINNQTIDRKQQKESVRYVVPRLWIRKSYKEKRFCEFIKESFLFLFDKNTYFVSSYFKEPFLR